MLNIIQDKINSEVAKELVTLCPFKAIEYSSDKLSITAACKMCKLCVKHGSGAIEFVEEGKKSIDKSLYNGITVFIDQTDGVIHPVSLELLGEAKKLAPKANQKVYAVVIGEDLEESIEKLQHFGIDKIFVYTHKALKNFKVDSYTKCFQDFIEKVKPNSILFGATNVGRSLAPRVAARVKTGLTADCTKLDMKANSDLVQIRPAFGGNIMAQIITTYTRPQLCTARYKVFDLAEYVEEKSGEVVQCTVTDEMVQSKITIQKIEKKQSETSISDAEVVIALGRGVAKKEDIEFFEKLASQIGAQLACTRPMMEKGWMDNKRQIGLSGRTVKPKLMICCGISGSVQFVSGMSSAEKIIAINTDKDAAIFNVAHIGIVGDMYEIVPKLIENIEGGKRV